MAALEQDTFTFGDTTAMLARTPGTLRAILSGLDERWFDCDEGPGTWSARDALAHMTDLEETDWPVRVRMILDAGEGTLFVPVDRLRFKRTLNGKSVNELLDLFSVRRARNLADVIKLGVGAQLERRGVHPDFGPVTMSQLLATWSVHDLTHISQIVRVIAKRYATHVGPWREYLSILSRDGPRALK